MRPDERDPLMGIDSVDPTSEEDRYGDGELTDTENPTDRVADDSGAQLTLIPVLFHVLVLPIARGGLVVLA